MHIRKKYLKPHMEVIKLKKYSLLAGSFNETIDSNNVISSPDVIL